MKTCRRRKNEEDRLGKFYDAMQKVGAPKIEDAVRPEPVKRELPELDDELLTPEGLEWRDSTDVLAEGRTNNLVPPEHPESLADPQKWDHESNVGQKQPAEPVLRVVDPEPEPQDETVPIVRRPTVTPMPRLRTDVFRRPIAAAYERIIQRLFSYRSASGESAILVCSAVPGEGASTVARSTATALAQHRNERVLLIDANLRTPSQHQVFGLDVSEGLGDILLGTTTVASAVQEEVVPGLSLLTSGCAMESPAQLLTVSSFQSAILAVLSLYDWVIIDGPPVTSYPDVASIAAAVSGAILVIEAESTRQEVVEEAKRVLDVSGVDLLGAVLNRRRYHIPGFIYRRL
jgi:protein-tyrosine kinase